MEMQWGKRVQTVGTDILGEILKIPHGAAHSPMGQDAVQLRRSLKEFRMWSFYFKLLAEPRRCFLIYLLHISKLCYSLEIEKATFG